MARKLAPYVDTTAIIRPRGGDFLYTPAEIQTMICDMEMALKAGAEGVSFGCLTKEGDIDVELLHRLVAAAKPMMTTFHRAFDMCRDPFTALEQIIDARCDRILTSGQQPDAVRGIPLIAELVKRARGRIVIMPGGGVCSDNIDRIQAETRAREFHISARSVVHSAMEYRNEAVSMGGSVVTSEFEILQTDRRKVAACLKGI
jgi:copper homeostasis protein